MTDFVKIIPEYGVLVVIAAVFLWNFLKERAESRNDKIAMIEAIQANAKSQENIAQALELLRESTKQNSEVFMRHDDRAVEIDRKLTRIEDAICKK